MSSDALGSGGSGVQIAPPRPNPLFSVLSLCEASVGAGTAHLPPVQWTSPIYIENVGVQDPRAGNSSAFWAFNIYNFDYKLVVDAKNPIKPIILEHCDEACIVRTVEQPSCSHATDEAARTEVSRRDRPSVVTRPLDRDLGHILISP